MGPLVVVMPGRAPVTPAGKVKMSAKTLAGMEAYARRWSGEVVMVTRPNTVDDDFNLGSSWMNVGDLPFAFHANDDIVGTVRGVRASVVLAPHHPDFAPLLAERTPVVLTSEIPAREAARASLADGPGTLTATRIVAGAVRYEWRLRAMAHRAAGLQCNGWPAWLAYSRLSADPILFYDTRLRHEQLAEPGADVRFASADVPFRLGFSGRFFVNKGPGYVVALARRLHELRLPVRVTMVGEGPLAEDLRAQAAGLVEFHPPMAFEPEWLRWARDDVDLMVLPHVQGDPSGTYLESVGVGVPVLGFDNASLGNLVRRFGIGWTVPVGAVDALVDGVRGIRDSPGEWALRRERGIAFMAEHTFEHEFDLRVEQLERIAGR